MTKYCTPRSSLAWTLSAIVSAAKVTSTLSGVIEKEPMVGALVSTVPVLITSKVPVEPDGHACAPLPYAAESPLVSEMNRSTVYVPGAL